MASLSVTRRHYKIRVYDSSRDPKEKAKYLSRSAWTKGEALAYLAKVEQLEERGTWNPWTRPWPGHAAEGGRGATLSLMEAVEKYAEHKRRLGERGQQGGWNEGSYLRHSRMLQAFARLVGASRRASSLERRDVETWIFQKHLSEASQRAYRRLLKTFLGWLREEGHLSEERILPRAFRAPRRTLRDYCTEEDLKEICKAHRRLILEQCQGKHVSRRGPSSPVRRWPYALAFRLAFYQGLRRGEVVALRAGAVDLERGVMAVGDLDFVPKGRHEKLIPVMPPAGPILACLFRNAKSRRSRLFGLTRGKPLSESFRAARRAAFPYREKLNFKALRLSASVYWLERGLPMRDVQNLLRHASITTTEKHYDQYVLKGARERAEAAYGS